MRRTKIPVDSKTVAVAYETAYNELWCHLPDNSAGFWITKTADTPWAVSEIERRARICGWSVVWTQSVRVHKERVKVRRIGLADKAGQLIATTTHVPAGRIVVCGDQYLKAVPLSHFRNGERKAQFYARVDALPCVHPKTGEKTNRESS